MILLTGATGFVGGRLLAALERDGRPVRAVTRRPEALADRVAASTEVVRCDVNDVDSLRPALSGVDAAYYLVHSLGSSGSFRDDDRAAAETFARAAADASVGRLIYLGGLGGDDELSEHLASRQEVGEILRASGVPTIELRASIVIGPGSASFELVRTLVDRAPALVLPDWVENLSQPIAVDDVVAYLVAALDVPVEESAVYEIGGADRVSYRAILEAYARATGKSLPAVSVPVPAPLASVADVPAFLTRLAPERALTWAALVESLRHPTPADDDEARRVFGVEPMGLRKAIDAALT